MFCMQLEGRGEVPKVERRCKKTGKGKGKSVHWKHSEQEKEVKRKMKMKRKGTDG